MAEEKNEQPANPPDFKMTDYNGVWKLDKFFGAEEFLTYIGVGWLKRKAIQSMGLTLTIKIEDKKIKLSAKPTILKERSDEYEFDKEVEQKDAENVDQKRKHVINKA